jgi:hypothetical protein
MEHEVMCTKKQRILLENTCKVYVEYTFRHLFPFYSVVDVRGFDL